MRLEDLHPETVVRGILPDALVTVAAVEWHGSEAHPPLSRSPLSLRQNGTNRGIMFRGCRLQIFAMR